MLRLVLTLLALLALPAAAQTRVAPESREQIQLSFAPVVKRTAPAVVNVFSRHTVRTSPLNDPFFRLFGETERVLRSLGSGVLVAPDGTIVTNHHVIKDADEVTVVLPDRREFEARILRADERVDLAILKIDVPGEKLPFLELRDSDELEVGDLVLAIGNPFGIGQTVTSGIVSALARTGVGVSDYRFFIQTDAAINPGNSGGALVSLDGKLVGINASIVSQSGGSIGIGFAIPSLMVRTVLAGAGTTGRIIRPWLGASGQPVTPDLVPGLGLRRPVGVLLNDIAPNSPASRAGLRIGDVVAAINGHEVEDVEALRFRVATLPVGGSAHILAYRNGAERDVEVALTAPPEDPPRDLTELRGNEPLAGATVANLSPALADEIGVETTARGVIVVDIARGSIAARLHLAQRDVIVSINGKTIGSVAQLRQLVDTAPPQWQLTIRRNGKLQQITVRA